MNDKCISILTVICQYMVFLYQYEWQDFFYPLWVVPNRVLESRKVTTIVGVCYSCIAVDRYIFSTRRISDVWHIFSVDDSVACWLVFIEAPIIINTSFCCSSQDGIYHTHYVRIVFVLREHFLGFICVMINMQDFMWWGLIENNSRIWEIIPFFGGDSHHDNTWCILNINQCFLFSSSIRRLVTRFYLFHITEYLCILFEIFLCGAFNVFRIVGFYPQ